MSKIERLALGVIFLLGMSVFLVSLRERAQVINQLRIASERAFGQHEQILDSLRQLKIACEGKP